MLDKLEDYLLLSNSMQKEAKIIHVKFSDNISICKKILFFLKIAIQGDFYEVDVASLFTHFNEARVPVLYIFILTSRNRML